VGIPSLTRECKVLSIRQPLGAAIVGRTSGANLCLEPDLGTNALYAAPFLITTHRLSRYYVTVDAIERPPFGVRLASTFAAVRIVGLTLP